MIVIKLRLKHQLGQPLQLREKQRWLYVRAGNKEQHVLLGKLKLDGGYLVVSNIFPSSA